MPAFVSWVAFGRAIFEQRGQRAKGVWSWYEQWIQAEGRLWGATCWLGRTGLGETKRDHSFDQNKNTNQAAVMSQAQSWMLWVAEEGGITGRIAPPCTCRMRKACTMSGRLKPVWRGVWEGVENSRPWCPLAVDDIGPGCLWVPEEKGLWRKSRK